MDAGHGPVGTRDRSRCDNVALFDHTAQAFVRLGLVDEYILTVHPIALGSGKRVFTGKTGLELIDAKTGRQAKNRI